LFIERFFLLDSDTDDSSGEDEELKAPNELIMEFLQCVMTDDIENGLKLCKMSKYRILCGNTILFHV